MPNTSNRAKASKQNGTEGTPEPKKLSEQQTRELLDWGSVILPYSKTGETNVPGWKQAALSKQILEDVL